MQVQGQVFGTAKTCQCELMNMHAYEPETAATLGIIGSSILGCYAATPLSSSPVRGSLVFSRRFCLNEGKAALASRCNRTPCRYNASSRCQRYRQLFQHAAKLQHLQPAGETFPAGVLFLPVFIFNDRRTYDRTIKEVGHCLFPSS